MKSSMMMMIMTAVVALAVVVARVGGDAVADQCASEFPKVTQCLTYATGKADTPTAECCKSVTDLKDRKPVCLCYIIQQIHDGSNPQIKSMGIQESRLLQLPTVCKLANASSAECPKLLGLAPNSPDAAIFSDNSTSTAPAGKAAPAAPGTSASPSTTSTDSPSSAYTLKGMKPAIGVLALTAVLTTAFFSC